MLAKKLLIVTALVEAGAGLALLQSPRLVAELLLGASLDGPAALVVGRVAGAALLSLGGACWLARNDGPSRALRGLLAALLLYNTAAVAILASADVGASLVGVLLWPAVALHAALAVWCIACLRERNMRTTCTVVALVIAVIGMTERPASAQAMAKAQVANLIGKVENGVDEFRKYLEKRGENARETSSTTQSSGRSKRQATESQKAQASNKKDALDDALGDLNQSTNRLRRQFDATDTWMETKGRTEKVVDDARKINQVIARGSYGAEAARLWAVLRSGINDLARAYGVAPLGA